MIRKKCVYPVEKLRLELASNCEQWQKYRERPDRARPIYRRDPGIDENGYFARLASTGQRLHAKAHYRHLKTMTFTESL